jgi:hypothetical protein
MIPLQGGRNFRDLGGYTIADDRRIRCWTRRLVVDFDLL